MSKIQLQATDRAVLKSRTYDAAGNVVVGAALARTGVQDYFAYELGLDAILGYDPMRKIKMLRPEAEVFHPESMASFDKAPVTVDHPADMVDDTNRLALSVGSVSGIDRLGDLMTATLKIAKGRGTVAIDEGKVEVSNGYLFELDITAGIDAAHGPYDAVQRNIRGNHVALVKSARCGSACRIADSIPTQKEIKMELKIVVVDGVPVEVSNTAAAVISKLVAASDSLKATNDAAIDAINDEHAKTLAAKDAEIDALKKDVMTPAARDAMVADWAAMLVSAKKLVPAIATDGKTCHAIRKEVLASVAASDEAKAPVIAAMLGNVAPDAASEDRVRAAFDALAAMPASALESKAIDAKVADALLNKTEGKPEKLLGRAAYMANFA